VEEVVGDWRRPHNEELQNLYASAVIVKIIKSLMMRWAGHVARMGAIRNAYKILVGKLEWKIPFGRPRRRWKDNIRMDLEKIGWESVDWIHLSQDRDQWRALVNTVMNLWVP
jgi:hypothetical protein